MADSDDDMDFTKPQATDAPAASPPVKAAASRFYDAQAAAKVFRAAGREERFTAGQQIFAEDDKAAKSGLFSRRLASRMYYVAEGEVALEVSGKPLDVIKAGEVLGEMGVISELPRSATATAKGDCLTYSLDTEQLQAALSTAPEFGLMLASIMFERLRFLAARLASRPMARGAAAREGTVFGAELLAGLVGALPRTAVLRYPAETIIMKEGQAGAYMYVVKTGRVAIAVGANVVEVVNPGGTFGEMALIDQSPRTARAGALVDSELIAIDRASLLAIVKKQPAFGMAMLRGIADRLRHMNSLLG